MYRFRYRQYRCFFGVSVSAKNGRYFTDTLVVQSHTQVNTELPGIICPPLTISHRSYLSLPPFKPSPPPVQLLMSHMTHSLPLRIKTSTIPSHTLTCLSLYSLSAFYFHA